MKIKPQDFKKALKEDQLTPEICERINDVAQLLNNNFALKIDYWCAAGDDPDPEGVKAPLSWFYSSQKKTLALQISFVDEPPQWLPKFLPELPVSYLYMDDSEILFKAHLELINSSKSFGDLISNVCDVYKSVSRQIDKRIEHVCELAFRAAGLPGKYSAVIYGNDLSRALSNHHIYTHMRYPMVGAVYGSPIERTLQKFPKDLLTATDEQVLDYLKEEIDATRQAYSATTRARALSELSPEERAILGIKDEA